MKRFHIFDQKIDEKIDELKHVFKKYFIISQKNQFDLLKKTK